MCFCLFSQDSSYCQMSQGQAVIGYPKLRLGDQAALLPLKIPQWLLTAFQVKDKMQKIARNLLV